MSVVSREFGITPDEIVVDPGARSSPEAPFRSNTSFRYCAPADVRDESTGLSWNVAVAVASAV